ncbi:MAG TPA: hypothetical protein VKC34_17755 [Blastocatellia bacterium]|nr:hypothetical protein [Blastocatellia bacterium]
MKTKQDEDFFEAPELELTDEELDGIKGGTSSEPTRPPGGGGFINNHNETVGGDEEDEINEIAQLADLPVAVEQADEVRGGPDGGTSSRTGGLWINNHNETVAGDEEDDSLRTDGTLN